MEKFLNREDAGKQLARTLLMYANDPQVLVLGLARGGIPVAYEIAKILSAPLDVFLVRKLGVPEHNELAMGAISTGGVRVFNNEIIRDLNIPQDEIQAVIAKEELELDRRALAYRGSTSFPAIKDKKIILVDDGIATGATLKAAIKAIYQLHPNRIVVAVPVADLYVCESFESLVDEFHCLLKPNYLTSVGMWYEDFSQVEDEEVSRLLALRMKK